MTEPSVKLLASVNKLARHGDLGARYKQGPQGNSVTDYRQEYLDRYGAAHGEISSTVSDIRDNRDPSTVGAEFLAQRGNERAAAGNGHSHDEFH